MDFAWPPVTETVCPYNVIKQWYSGIYKIVFYPAIDHGDFYKKAHYCAYFKPKGWTNWGNRVRQDTTYQTREEAEKDCYLHSTLFCEPGPEDRIPGRH